MTKRILLLRIVHGLLALYFILCLLYLGYVALTGKVNDTLFIISIISLTLEGIVVFTLNSGDCPLIHIQRKIGDDKPFFELFLPPRLAMWAIPVFAAFGMVILLVILLRFVVGGN